MNIHLLNYLGLKISENGTKTYSFVGHTLLYHFYQIHTKGKKYPLIFQKWETILKNLSICKSKASEWINSEEAFLFLDVRHVPGRPNEIKVKEWVLEAYDIFEKLGLMKWFRSDPKKWKRVFFERFQKILDPLLELGLTLRQIYERLMNKLSTKNAPKREGSEAQKGKGQYIKSPCSIKSKEHLDRNREIPSFLAPFLKIKEFLSDRLQMKDGDINFFINNYSLNQNKSAIREVDLWLKRGLMCVSPVKTFQRLLSKRLR